MLQHFVFWKGKVLMKTSSFNDIGGTGETDRSTSWSPEPLSGFKCGCPPRPRHTGRQAGWTSPGVPCQLLKLSTIGSGPLLTVPFSAPVNCWEIVTLLASQRISCVTHVNLAHPISASGETAVEPCAPVGQPAVLVVLRIKTITSSR